MNLITGASIATANDRRCDGKEDGALCFCTERMKKGVCKEGECQCTSLTRRLDLESSLFSNRLC